MKRAILAALIAASLVCAGDVLAQQQFPTLERGLQADKLYQFGGIDNINLFNGNLTIALPIGPSYPVSGGLSYQLTLSYNSNQWDFNARGDNAPFCQGPTPAVDAIPARNSNAGIGWSLGFGSFVAANNPVNYSFLDLYVAPDGGEHRFDSPKDDASATYTSDGSNLRLRTFGSPRTVTWIDFPDGSVQRYEKNDAGDWELRAINAPRGPGQITITTLTRQPAQCDAGATLWQSISDGIRTHYVCSKNYEMDGQQKPMVQTVVLDGPQGQPAVYRFAYEPLRDVPRPTGEHCYCNSCRTSHKVAVLKSLLLPDQSSYSFNVTASASLAGLTLPTGGQIEYRYGLLPNIPPASICGYVTDASLPVWSFGSELSGVYTRTFRPAVPAGTAPQEQRWSYVRTLPPQIIVANCIGPFGKPLPVVGVTDQLVVSVRDSIGKRTDSYFSVWPGDMVSDSPNGVKNLHYAFPYGAYDAAQNRYLSQEQYQCDPFVDPLALFPTGCSKLRSMFVRHDAADTSSYSASRRDAGASFGIATPFLSRRPC
jgi:hypothetical protein